MRPQHATIPLLVLALAACAKGANGDASSSVTASASAGQTTGTESGTTGATATGTTMVSGSVGSGSTAAQASGTSGSSGPGSTTAASTGTTAGTTAGSSTGASSGGGLMCNPDYEPNDTEQQAAALGIIDDCDGSGSSFSAQLEGDADVDWYTYSASDVLGCVVNPSRDVITPAAVRFCKFVNCASGQASIDSCPSGASAATSPSGYPGCCKYGTNLSNFDVAIDCPGSDDSAQILMRIDSGPAGVCTSYSINYHF